MSGFLGKAEVKNMQNMDISKRIREDMEEECDSIGNKLKDKAGEKNTGKTASLVGWKDKKEIIRCKI